RLQPCEQALRQRDDRLAGTPSPVALRIGAAEAEPNDARLQVEGEAVGLPFLTAVISGIAEQPASQERKGLQLLIGGGEAIVPEEVVAALLDHVVQRHEAGIVRLGIALALEGRDGRSDDLALLPGWPRLGLGANEPHAQDGRHPLEGMFALGLGAQEAAEHLRLAAPLPAPMGLRTS